MFKRAILRAAAAVLVLFSGSVWAGDAPVPAATLIPNDAVLVVRVVEPKSLIGRAFDQQVVRFVQALPPYQQALTQPQMQPVLTMVNFFETKYSADLPTLLGKLLGGGLTLALGPNDAALLIVDAEDEKMVGEMHEFFLTIAKGEAAKQGNADRVKSADYRGITGWTFAPGESHAIIGSRLLVANKPESLKAAIDRQLDNTGRDATQSSRYETAIAAIAGKPQVTVYADMAVLKQLPGFQQGLAQNDNPMARLLFAPFLTALSEATWLAAGLDLNAERLAADVVVDRTAGESTKLNSFALPLKAGEGAMPNLVVPGQIAGLSFYRDLHEFYAAKDKLFPNRTSGLIFFENMMGIFFSGKDLTNEVLAETLPEVRVVVAEQSFDEKTGTPAMPLPGFAAIVQLRDPANFELVMKEAWQTAIGLVNVTSGQKAQPKLIIDSASHNGTTYSTSFFSTAGQEQKGSLDVRFNFRPSLAVVGDRLILSSSNQLVCDLIDALQQEKEQGVTPLNGQHTMALVKSGPLAAVLEANREALIRQNMVEDGKSREEATQETAGLFLLMKHLTELQVAAGNQADRSNLTIQLKYALPQ